MAGKRWIRLDVSWEDSEWLDALDGTAAGCWPRMLCLVKRDGVRGRVKRPAFSVLARRWRVPVEAIAALEDAAIADRALAIEDGDWVVLNWPEYNDYDKTGADRQRRYRETKHRLSPLRVTQRDKRSSTRDLSMSMSNDVSRTKETSRKSKILLPAEWQPDEKHRAYAMGQGLDVADEAERMRDWATANATKRVDWDAQFRNWLRQAAERKRNVVPIRSPDGITKEDIRTLLVAAGDWVYHESARKEALRGASERHPELWQRARQIMWKMNYGTLYAVRGNDFQFDRALESEIRRLSA